MNPKLIGLNGKARSGKDTTADHIQSWCKGRELTTARRGFADLLKRSAAHSLGIFNEEINYCAGIKRDGVKIGVYNENNVLTNELTGREFLQYYGTEAHRDVFGDNFWVDALLPLGPDDDTQPNWCYNFYTSDLDPWVADVCIITDVRFDNEAERIQELGGDIWKVERDGSGAGNHASEQDIPMEYVDAVIDNNGTLDDLSGSVEVLMEMITDPEDVGIHVAG